MKKHIVIAYFLKPHGDPFAAKTIEIDWNDRAMVRDFARQSDECLNDGARSSFITLRTTFGLTIPPGLAARRVACVLREYTPLAQDYAANAA